MQGHKSAQGKKLKRANTKSDKIVAAKKGFKHGVEAHRKHRKKIMKERKRGGKKN